MTIETAIAELETLLGERFSRSKSDLDQHSHSETYFDPIKPDGVAFAETTQDVSQIIKVCAKHDCPVVAWGKGTSLEGHSLAVRGGVTLDLSRMNNVLELNAEDMDARVQPGLTRMALNEELRATGLFFPVDPGANASLGGMASTRASGTTAVRYGTMRDNVMALEVVLADGRIIRTGTRARKSSAGYDLTGLFVGSEGTLGIITELTLKLHGQPPAIGAAVCAFETVGDAVGTVIETIQMGVPMARIELLDAASVTAVNAHGALGLPEQPHLLVEFHGSEPAVAEDAETLKDIASEHSSISFNWATKTEDRNKLWQVRHDAYHAITQRKPGSTALVTDVCVPISKLARAIEETQTDIENSPIDGPILGHVGDGNFHAILLVDPQNTAEIRVAKELSAKMAERALNLGGTVTGEHGVGMGKLDLMQAEHGDAWSVMGLIKKAIDPKSIMNPGKLVNQN